MKVKVIDGCIGCGACMGICPEVFAENGDGLAEVRGSSVPYEFEKAVAQAAENCPVSVIETE